MSRASVRGRRAFAMPELAAVALVVLLMLALALPAARRARLAGWDAVDGENLHRFAGATTAYAADNGDRYWTFSWKKEDGYASDLEAAVIQAIDILHRKAGRGDIAYIPNWYPHPYYSHLPLYDYLNQQMPALWGVCPADRHRLDWARDPAGFDNGVFLPCQPSPMNANKRWPYSSSYELSTSFFDQSPVGERIYQAGVHNQYVIPGGADLHGRLLGDTAFPSQKVHLYEQMQFHFGEDGGGECTFPALFVVPDSRIAILFTDGHSALKKTSEANPGWQPNNPQSPDPTLIGDYPGVYRWTRGYLAGRDFGGPEVGP